jgi:hypothetical protein
MSAHDELATEAATRSEPEPGGERVAARQSGGRPGFPWVLFACAETAYLLIKWSISAIPASFGEPLGLRWLRAFAEHPVRSPLGLALAYVGLAALARALLNRPPRA